MCALTDSAYLCALKQQQGSTWLENPGGERYNLSAATVKTVDFILNCIFKDHRYIYDQVDYINPLGSYIRSVK